jgi:hypothetical protein
MTAKAEELRAIAAEWRRARRLHPVLVGIADRFGLNVPPCKELDSPIDTADPEALTNVRRWLQHMDEAVQPHQLRYFLQTSPLVRENHLRALTEHFLQKKERYTPPDRDKLDFLLVQYFAQCAPLAMLEGEPALDDVAQVLEPVLGKVNIEVPGWLEPLEELTSRTSRCGALQELLQSGILAQVRRIKVSAEDSYFTPIALVAFARLNYLIRQTFFRLMHNDVHAIAEGVRKLRSHKVATINCARAQLSSSEPLARVLALSTDWRKPFQAEYSAGNPFTQLAELRTCVDEALAQHGIQLDKPKRMTAAVGRSTSAAATLSSPALTRPAPPQQPFVVRPAPPVPAAKLSSPGKSPPQSLLFEREEPPLPPPAATTPASEMDLAEEMHKVLVQLSSYLKADPTRTRTTGATLVLNHARLALSSWEVTAFVEGLGEFSEVIQEGVVARVLLFQAMEAAKQGGSPERLATLMDLARMQVQRLQEALTESRDARNIEATVTLSATSQRLSALLQESEKISGRKRY